MTVENQKILVIGSARSGLGAAKLAHLKGALVCIFDQKPFEQLNEETKEAILTLKKSGITFILGETVDVRAYDMLIVSPGVPMDLPIIMEALSLKKEVVGEFEFASSYCKAPILAITGTNGKTTTTALVGEIAKAFNPHTYIVGNIGRAFSEDVLAIPEEGIVVAEVSSFQLETTKHFHPQVAALLNITPDHLNRHKTMENYCHTKYRVCENQTKEDYMILNYQDTYYEDAKKHISSQIILFNSKEKVERGAYVFEEKLYENIEGKQHCVCAIKELKILGEHNIENALAAICITKCFGIPDAIIEEVLKAFRGVEHRIEYVCTKKNVDYFNDSKATNTGAAIPGLLSMRKPIRLIAGGMDKKTTFLPWIKLFKGRVKKVYVIGETKEQIVEECARESFTAVRVFETFEEAILAAYTEAEEGECVLLSPACASWDMFESYEQRGDLFKEIVNQLEG